MTRSFVVTGGARGVGLAIAERLAEDGARGRRRHVAARAGSGDPGDRRDATDDAVLETRGARSRPTARRSAAG